MPHKVLIRFIDGEQGTAYSGTWTDDGSSAHIMDQDELDLIRWDNESPNAEPFYHNVYENLKELIEGKNIYLKSGRVIRRKHHKDLIQTYGDETRSIYRMKR